MSGLELLYVENSYQIFVSKNSAFDEILKKKEQCENEKCFFPIKLIYKKVTINSIVATHNIGLLEIYITFVILHRKNCLTSKAYTISQSFVAVKTHK